MAMEIGFDAVFADPEEATDFRPAPGRREQLRPGLWSLWADESLSRLRWLLRVRGEALQKRLMDVLGTIALAPVILPVTLVAAVFIKLTDGGPVLHWQKRVGWRGAEFDFPKLRSMSVDAEAGQAVLAKHNAHGDGVTFKIRNDPRVTWIGRLIRRWSIDELSQFWCVLAGDMSLVGPRPALPSEVSRYTQTNRRRLDATPGLTCLWQVNGRADIPFEKQVVLDVDYINRRSIVMDLGILCMTVPAVVTGRGAY